MLGHLPICIDIIGHKLKQSAKIGINAIGILERLRNRESAIGVLSRNNENLINELFETSYLDLNSNQQLVFSSLSILANSEFSLDDVKAINNYLLPTEVEDAIQVLLSFSVKVTFIINTCLL